MRQAVNYPDEEKNRVFGKSRSKTEKVAFVCYADFESVLVPSGQRNVINTHEPCGVAVYVVSSYEGEGDNKIIEPYLYSEPDVMGTFFDYMLSVQQHVSCLLGKNVTMFSLTRDEQSKFENSLNCSKCGELYTVNNHKTRHHNHVTGLFIDAVCNSCNLQIHYRKHKRWNPLKDRVQYEVDPKEYKAKNNKVGDNNFGYNLDCIFTDYLGTTDIFYFVILTDVLYRHLIHRLVSRNMKM